MRLRAVKPWKPDYFQPSPKFLFIPCICQLTVICPAATRAVSRCSKQKVLQMQKDKLASLQICIHLSVHTHLCAFVYQWVQHRALLLIHWQNFMQFSLTGFHEVSQPNAKHIWLCFVVRSDEITERKMPSRHHNRN